MTVEKVWGVEHWIVNNPQYCGKILHLRQGWQCSLHYHRVKDETFYVLTGLVAMQVGDTHNNMRPGDNVHIPPGTKHRFGGLEDSTIIEFSTHHDEDDSYRLELSRPRRHF